MDTDTSSFGLRLSHVGINAQDADDAQQIAQQFCDLLNLGRTETPKSSFAGTLVEVMNNQGRGTHGHIALHVDDMNAAEAFFTSRGYELDESSRMLNPDGSTFLIYLKKEIAGFAIHLTRS